MAFGFTQPMKMRLDELISGVRSDLAVKVFGDDPDRNLAGAQDVAAAIRGVEGTAEVQVEQTTGQGYLSVRMDRDALARYGIPVSEVQEVLEVALGGVSVAEAVDGAYTIPISVLYPESVRSSPDAIRRLTVASATGALIRLSELADVRMESGPVQVSREQAQRLVIVQADVEGRDLGGYVSDVQAAIAAVGGVLALWLRDLHLSVSASIGFIALFGVAVLNGLVLLSTVQRLREEGMDAGDAALVGARERLRPVLMTALVASIGFIPVAVC